MEVKGIKTLGQLQEFINQNEDWMLETNDVIEANGWVDETGTPFGICNDGKQRLLFNDDMKAVVVEME